MSRILKPTTRAADEALLHMLRLRSDGLSSYQIAERVGKRATAVRVATFRVVADDLALSGEDRTDVLRHYWPGAR